MNQQYCADEHPEYWEEYSNLQRVKHRLIEEYLKGWFPKLGLWAGRILYIDTHAGRGRHETGDPGSPLIALGTFLRHRHRDQILNRSEARFFFLERDPYNQRALQSELDAFNPLPARVQAMVVAGSYDAVLGRIVDDLHTAHTKLAPSFVFVDPYTFKIRYSLLRDLMSFRRVELFINVRWRELNMIMTLAQHNPDSAAATTLDQIFDIFDWRPLVMAADSEMRLGQSLELIRNGVAAKWMTHVRMLGSNRATTHVLAHFTNHEAGRDLMKTAMWKVCPDSDGVFVARKTDDPAQGVLLTPDPDLQPLAQFVLRALAGGPVRWARFHAMIRDTSWLEKHLNQVVRDLRRRGQIDCEDGFSAKANPLLRLHGE